MSNVKLFSMAVLALAMTACQQQKIGSAPKPQVSAAPGAPGPRPPQGPGPQVVPPPPPPPPPRPVVVGPPPPPPQPVVTMPTPRPPQPPPPRYPELEPIDIRPNPPPPPPRTPEREPLDLPTPPPPLTDGPVRPPTPPTRPETPPTRVTPREQVPLPPPRPQNLGRRTQMPANVPLPPPRPRDLGKPLPERPVDDPGATQVVRPPAPPPGENCVGREGEACRTHEAKPGSCQAVPVRLNEAQGKLDILFVMDTSLSLRGGTKGPEHGELVQIARDMENFVSSIKNPDFRIGVLLGHGPRSQWHGKLFAGRGDQAVLKLEGGQAGRARLWKALEQKILQIPNDSSDAQGEAMMLSLYRALKDPARRNAIRQAGLLREGAALAVILVSDEQDVCFNYEGTQFRPVVVPNKVRDARGRVIRTERGEDEHERRFRTQVCAKAVNGKPLTAGHVWDALQGVQSEVLKIRDSEKLIMNGIYYKSNEGLKSETDDEDENEMGHGLIELVEHLGNGEVADMRTEVMRRDGRVSFAPALKRLGEYTGTRLSLSRNTFNCRSNTHPNAVNPTSVEITIVDKAKGAPIGKFSSACAEGRECSVTGGLRVDRRLSRDGTPYLQFEVPHQTLKQLMTQHQVREAEAQINFMTVSDVDPATGGARGGAAAAQTRPAQPQQRRRR